MQARTVAEAFRRKGVTYVSGINRNLCVQNGPKEHWLGRLDSNQGMAVPKTAALPLGYAPTSDKALLGPEVAPD